MTLTLTPMLSVTLAVTLTFTLTIMKAAVRAVQKVSAIAVKVRRINQLTQQEDATEADVALAQKAAARMHDLKKAAAVLIVNAKDASKQAKASAENVLSLDAQIAGKEYETLSHHDKHHSSTRRHGAKMKKLEERIAALEKHTAIPAPGVP